MDDVPESVTADESPFMVILDPGTDGDPHEAIPRLRRRLHRTVPILVVSGTVDTAEVFAEGASALLTKPIDEREFLIAVKEMITAKGWRVLVAERNTDLRILIKRALEQRGFLVDDVDRGSQVMSRIEQEDYDLALLDLDFTDVSARELLKVIRRGREPKRCFARPGDAERNQGGCAVGRRARSVGSQRLGGQSARHRRDRGLGVPLSRRSETR